MHIPKFLNLHWKVFISFPLISGKLQKPHLMTFINFFSIIKIEVDINKNIMQFFRKHSVGSLFGILFPYLMSNSHGDSLQDTIGLILTEHNRCVELFEDDHKFGFSVRMISWLNLPTLFMSKWKFSLILSINMISTPYRKLLIWTLLSLNPVTTLRESSNIPLNYIDR